MGEKSPLSLRTSVQEDSPKSKRRGKKGRGEPRLTPVGRGEKQGQGGGAGRGRTGDRLSDVPGKALEKTPNPQGKRGKKRKGRSLTTTTALITSLSPSKLGSWGQRKKKKLFLRSFVGAKKKSAKKTNGPQEGRKKEGMILVATNLPTLID